jgi:endonuclease/exonuclease/phosphatase family metal-dependent hydrolase
MSTQLIETGSFTGGEVMPHRPDEIRVISWNIARGTRLEEITEFLAGMNAELILLQETDRNARRSGWRDVAAEIARALGMNYAFGIEFEELAQGSRASPAYHGQATLSVFPLSDFRVLRFRRQSKFWHPYWGIPRLAAFQRRVGGRMALMSHICVGATMLAVYNLHLESRSDEIRRAQFAELLDEIGQNGCEIPVIVGGDFNFDLTESFVACELRTAQFRNPFHLQRAPTVRSRRRTIDCMLIKGPVHASAALVHSSVSASDHYPLSLTLQLS